MKTIKHIAIKAFIIIAVISIIAITIELTLFATDEAFWNSVPEAASDSNDNIEYYDHYDRL